VQEDSGIERLEQAAAEVVGERRTIVTALPLKAAARERLSQLLRARVLDVREPCDHPDIVLTPACSPQLVGALKRKYHGARVVIVELDDWGLDIEFGGPVKRLLTAGADAYLLADSLDELAAELASTERHAADAPALTSAPVDHLIAAFLRETSGAESNSSDLAR
jgi:hypothetical protein